MVKFVTYARGWNGPLTSAGCGAVGGGGGGAAGVLGGARRLGGVAGVPSKLMGQPEVDLVARGRSWDLWVQGCGGWAAPVICGSLG